jgi:MFS transporter, PPP family, 3-phenylpropionic acid transporter
MRGFFGLRAYYVAAFTVGGLYVPFFPRWLEARGIHGLELGVIAAASPAMGVLAPAAFGSISDALGLRGGLLSIACAGALVSWGSLTALALSGRHLGFVTLLAAALAFALFRSPMTLLADVAALENARSDGAPYGTFRMWGSLGFLAAVLVAARFVDPTDTAAFPLVTFAALAAAFVASFRIPGRTRMPRRERATSQGLLASTDFRILLGSVFLGQCAHAAYDLCFTLHLLDIGFSRGVVGIAWAIGVASEVALMAAAARAFRAFAPASLLVFGLGGAALRWWILATVRSRAVLLWLQPLHAISFGVTWLAAVHYTERRAPPGALGGAQGLLATAFGAGSVAGMLLWGPAYERGGGALVFGSAAGVAACACAGAMVLAPRTRAREGWPPTVEGQAPPR